MKRTLWIFAVVLAIGAGTIVALYFIRKDKALNQYVHPNSAAVVSVSLDRLLLDNIDQFFKRRTVDSVAPSLWDVNSWQKAGIDIPAQIHFFSMKEHPLTFYTIQKIKHLKEWEAFLTEHSTDSIRVLRHNEEQLSLAQLPSGALVLYDQQYILFSVGAVKGDTDDMMQAIWGEKSNWIYVRTLPFHAEENPKAHIAYHPTDSTFELFANISDGHVALSGNWHLTTPLPELMQTREPTIREPFISLQSTLPLTETPFITRAFSAFTETVFSMSSDIEAEQWIENTDDYVDFFVGSGATMQQDTIITYGYDEDFNTLEQTEIQEIKVPVIESLWKGNEVLAGTLPEKFFYRLHKHVTDSLVLLSTREKSNFSPTFVPASSPFQATVDFRQLPELWATDSMRALQQQALRITIETSISDAQTLGITGSIRYEEK